MKQSMRILVWNAKGLGSKSVEVKRYFVDYDIVVITETYFTRNVQHKFRLRRYQLFEHTCLAGRGGLRNI